VEVIVTLTDRVTCDPLAALAAPPDGATVVELRADLLPELDLEAAVAACPLPVLATLRSAAEGGRGPTDAGPRQTFAARAREAGAALIDLEFARDLEPARKLGLPPEQVVLSWHDHSGTPTELEATASAMLDGSAALVKIVPTSHSLADAARLLALFGRGRRHRRRLIAFGMGAIGVPTRLLSPVLGAPVAYCSWSEAAAAAPGQLTARRTTAIVGHLDGPPRRLFGVVGGDVTSSLSPELHSAGYRSLGLPDLFVPVSVADPDELPLLFCPAGETVFDRVGLSPSGWAVTTPYKESAAAAATRPAPRVVRSAAANTLVLRHGAVFADNTDADGVVASLKAVGIDLSDREAIVRGTGGAARGAAVGLDLAGARVELRGRDPERTRQWSERLDVGRGDPMSKVPDGAVLVNATPLGSRAGDEAPFTPDEVARAGVVVDMVYGPHEPQLALSARNAGTPYIDGRTVLAHQGFAQFAAFTGELPPKQAMLDAIEGPSQPLHVTR
jgi:3-dehydroquinate dehydratase type I